MSTTMSTTMSMSTMTTSFIYKYQPKTLTEFEMDYDLLELLNTLTQMNNLNILFVGDSGSGKTSLIQAMIREYYGSALQADNILYINSLKEQGTVYYRNDVKTFCQTPSLVPGKKKILVLDDLDVVNEQGQQVFRNCIDKYTHNVHFLASCSNTQKVIDSLQSRMTIIKLKVLSLELLRNIAKRVCTNEHIILEPAAQEFVLAVCNHSVRTLINYLEKFKLLGTTITADIAVASCTNISFQDFNKYTALCLQGPTALQDAIAVMFLLYDRGYSVMDILDNYFLFVKCTPLLTEEQKYAIVPVLCKYITIFHNIHEDDIELVLFTNDLIALLERKTQA